MKKFVLQNYRWYKQKLKSDCVDAYAAQSAFFIFIAFIPFALLLLSLLKFINIEGTNLIEFALELLPKDIADFFSSVISTEYKPLAIVSVAGFTSLWSSSKATFSLIKGLNSVFDVVETRNYFQLRAISLLYTLAFAVILTVTAILLVFGNSLFKVLENYFSPNFIQSFLGNKNFWGFCILSVFFALTYKTIPYKVKTPLRHCFVGACLAAFGWMAFSALFGIFVENFSDYSNMYGSLAALVIVMLWLYFCMYIMLFGGEIAVWLQKSSPVKIVAKTFKNL